MILKSINLDLLFYVLKSIGNVVAFDKNISNTKLPFFTYDYIKIILDTTIF